ncbi:MAG: hypothetical protein K0S36_726 [Nitrosospira multiformis]|jgi:hypothetical protein|nr:hypothetical protein [Nitrosospira multiformis]
MDRRYGPSCFFLAYGKDNIAAFMTCNACSVLPVSNGSKWIGNRYWIFLREEEDGMRFVLNEVMSLW